MKVEIRKSLVFDEWTWTCPVCHYGYNIPWESCATWDEAMTDVTTHLALHRTTGMRLEWTPVRTRECGAA